MWNIEFEFDKLNGVPKSAKCKKQSIKRNFKIYFRVCEPRQFYFINFNIIILYILLKDTKCPELD